MAAKNTEATFKQGDIVRFRGGQDEWTVEQAYDQNFDHDAGLCLYNGTQRIAAFNKNVELVRRPKARVKRTGWVNIYRDTSGGSYPGSVFHETKTEADQYTNGRVDCVRIKWEEEAADE